MFQVHATLLKQSRDLGVRARSGIDVVLALVGLCSRARNDQVRVGNNFVGVRSVLNGGMGEAVGINKTVDDMC